MDQKLAKNVYLWLWFSPFFTIPTLSIISNLDPGYLIVCGDGSWNCNWAIAERITSIIAVLLSSLWHLTLLKQALYKKNPFVRWHGRQGLALAGLRTSIPLFFALLFGLYEIISILAIPLLVIVWFLGTLLGQGQVKRGECSLAQWLGRTEEFSSLVPEIDLKGEQVTEPPLSEENLRSLIHIFRFSQDEKERERALTKLNELGVVEDL